MTDLVQLDLADPAVAVLTLNRPDKRNALSVALVESLIRAVQQLATARVVILRANGPAFCAGLDLDEAADSASAERSAHLLPDLFESLATLPAVTIAQVHGPAVAGGAALATCCDLIVAAAGAARFAYPEPQRGLVPALAACLLCRKVAPQVARQLLLTGQPIAAAHALQLGLVDRVVASASLAAETLATARALLRNAPDSLARTKRLLDDLGPRPLRDDLRRALDHHLAARRSPAAAEGIAAFRQKRRPQWDITV